MTSETVAGLHKGPAHPEGARPKMSPFATFHYRLYEPLSAGSLPKLTTTWRGNSTWKHEASRAHLESRLPPWAGILGAGAELPPVRTHTPI